MRKIKFRAWDKENDKIIDDVYNHSFYKSLNDCLENSLIMQFVGIQDINGKDIYEGDIINIGELPEYQNIIVDDIRCITHIIDAYQRRIWIKIIGNIYENPELLQQKRYT
jgi:hypothetical protein